MFTCERCGSQFSSGAVAVVGMPRPNVCRSCQRLQELEAEGRPAEQARHFERLSAIIMVIAAIICLAGMLRSEWKKTDPLPPVEVPPEPAVPESRRVDLNAALHVTPGETIEAASCCEKCGHIQKFWISSEGDRATPEELPRMPATSAAVMSLDFYLASALSPLIPGAQRP